MRKPARIWSAGLGLLLALGIAAPTAGHAAAAAEAKTAWLGVYTQALDEGLRASLNYRDEGVLVSRVVDESAADRAGVKKGDVIVSVNSRTVRTPEQLAEVIRGAKVGQRVSVVVWRDGTKRTLSATLAERPADLDQAQDFEWFEAPAPPATTRAPRPPGTEHDLEVNIPDFVWSGAGRGRLGVRVEDLNRDLADALGVPPDGGALVVEVMKETPAERAGLKAGDVITRVGDRTVADAGDLTRALRDMDEGKVKISLRRKGVTRTVEAELESRPRAYRFKSGGPMSMGDGNRRIVIRGLDEINVPDDLREEVRKLRDEVRELREQLEKSGRD